MNDYKSVHCRGSAEIIINKSRFIGHACPINNEKDALDFIEEINKRYHDATHNVYAYVLGDNSNIQRYSDNGEPSGTAGIPVLNVIKQSDLKNVVVVVTRYFGGIKLGAGGLVRAYTKGAKIGLENAQIIDKIYFTEIIVNIDYSLLGKLENEIIKNKYLIKNKIFEQKITIVVLCKSKDIDILKDIVTNATNGNIEISKGKSYYLSVKDGKLISI